MVFLTTHIYKLRWRSFLNRFMQFMQIHANIIATPRILACRGYIKASKSSSVFILKLGSYIALQVYLTVNSSQCDYKWAKMGDGVAFPSGGSYICNLLFSIIPKLLVIVIISQFKLSNVWPWMHAKLNICASSFMSSPTIITESLAF